MEIIGQNRSSGNRRCPWPYSYTQSSSLYNQLKKDDAVSSFYSVIFIFYSTKVRENLFGNNLDNMCVCAISFDWKNYFFGLKVCVGLERMGGFGSWELPLSKPT